MSGDDVYDVARKTEGHEVGEGDGMPYDEYVLLPAYLIDNLGAAVHADYYHRRSADVHHAARVLVDNAVDRPDTDDGTLWKLLLVKLDDAGVSPHDDRLRFAVAARYRDNATPSDRRVLMAASELGRDSIGIDEVPA